MEHLSLIFSHSLSCHQHFSAILFSPLFQYLPTLSFLTPYLLIYSSVSRSIENIVCADKISFTLKLKRNDKK